MAISISIVGATGLVGSTLCGLLEEKNFPLKQLFLVASEHSAGKKIAFKNELLPVYSLTEFDFKWSQLAFFCVGNELTARYAPLATQLGNIVIDKSNCYRQHPDVPLIIPEVNKNKVLQYKKMNILASPNCTTIPISVMLKPIYDAVGISRINIATYQSVSGTGKEGVHELTEQSKQILNHEAIQPKVYPQQIAFNILPQIDAFTENGYTLEEMKMVLEIQKIFADANLKINPTAVRVPVFCGHAAAVHIETKEKLDRQHALALLANAPGITLCQDDTANRYPTPVTNAAGHDAIFVGRIREDLSHPLGLNLWVTADNLRKGAALNALQIAECLIQENAFSS